MQPIALKAALKPLFIERKINMNHVFAPITNLRSYLAYKFNALQSSAKRDLILAKLMGRDTSLQTFPSTLEGKNPNRKLLPIQEILIDNVVGTLNRHADFDYKFRPLKKVELDRWVNTRLILDQEGWEPILVHKVGSEYFVEDGHHRLSVAHELGLKYILAKVWEYPMVEGMKVNPCRTEKCAETNSHKLYVPG
jgi:hypothetical protein